MKLLVVEDHALVREGMTLTLRRLDRRIVVLEARDASDAVDRIAGNPDLDLVLLDLRLPGCNGFALLKSLRNQFPMIPILVVSGQEDAATINRSIQAGASGFVPKSSHSDVLLAACRTVLDGGIFLPDPAGVPAGRRGPVFPRVANDLDLTAAQRRVFDLLVQGLSNREIGDQLGLTEGTVKVHVSHIFRSLGISSRSQAVVMAARLGMKV